jgi:hypothetical protein
MKGAGSHSCGSQRERTKSQSMLSAPASSATSFKPRKARGTPTVTTRRRGDDAQPPTPVIAADLGAIARKSASAKSHLQSAALSDGEADARCNLQR